MRSSLGLAARMVYYGIICLGGGALIWLSLQIRLPALADLEQVTGTVQNLTVDDRSLTSRGDEWVTFQLGNGADLYKFVTRDRDRFAQVVAILQEADPVQLWVMPAAAAPFREIWQLTQGETVVLAYADAVNYRRSGAVYITLMLILLVVAALVLPSFLPGWRRPTPTLELGS